MVTSPEKGPYKAFKCNKCLKILPQNWRLTRHMKTCKGITTQAYQTFECTRCYNSFSKWQLYKHNCKVKRKNHYKCKCSKTFKKPSTLKGHQEKCQAHQSSLRKTPKQTEAKQYDEIVKDRWKTYDKSSKDR